MSKIEENKEKTIDLWQQIDQPFEKIEAFTKWLEGTDYFQAPCSTEYHLCVPGGLAEHSLNVYDLLAEKAVRYKLDVTVSTLIICGLGHDLTKVNFYKIDDTDPSEKQTKYLKDLAGSRFDIFEYQGLSKAWCSKLIDWYLSKDGTKEMPVRESAYAVEDQFPFGHGEKSVSILQDFFTLSDAEKLAIRWHMCAFDASIHFSYPNGFPFREASKIPLVTLLFTADYEASQILERG